MRFILGVSTLDGMKLDNIETSEWRAFQNMFENGTFKRVKQISFEIHLLPMEVGGVNERTAADCIKRFSSFIQSLRRLLAEAIDWHQNDECFHCKELLWVNTRFAHELQILHGKRPNS